MTAATTGEGSKGHGQNDVWQPIVCKILKNEIYERMYSHIM